MLGTRKWSSVGVFLATVAAFLGQAPSAHAIKFANQFVEFELPFKWKCGLEGAEWVCQSEDENKKRDAIIVLAAKLKGEQDTLEKYTEYLKKPRKFTSPGGKEVSSDPKYVNNKTVNEHIWVDSMHMSSEIPDFFTRYMATTKEDIAVLVTYSVNKAKFPDYQKQFDDMITSLKVFRKKGTGLNVASTDLYKNTSGAIGSAMFNEKVDPGAAPVAAAAPTKPKDDGSGSLALIGLVALAGVGFIIYKKKKAAGG